MSKKTDWKSFRNKFVSEYLIITAIIALCIFTAVNQPAFFSYSNIVGLCKQLVPLGIISLGMTVIIIGGYIDLSVAGMLSFLGMLAAYLYNVTGPVSLILILLCGAACGAANAVILIGCGAKDDSDALFITFGMSTVFTALALLMNNGTAVILEQTDFTRFIGNGNVAGVPFMLFIFIACLIILQFFMKKTPTGRGIHLSGGNPVASSLCGIKSSKVIAIAYILTGVLVGLAAFIMTCRVGSATPIAGKNYETNAIMSVAIGGTSLQGGHGSVIRTLVGVALVTVMINALNILGVSTNMQYVWRGVILVVAIWLDARREV